MLKRNLFLKLNQLLKIKISRNFSLTNFKLSEKCIFAIASGLNQRCGVAVIRLSGKKSLDILMKMTNKNKFEPRKMYMQDIFNPTTKEKIDKGLVVWFKEPFSFTGENVCEFHIHGGPSVINCLLETLSSFECARHAEPGEFSRRSFLNGKMDLVEIEGLIDLVNSETELQRKQALNQMEGSLSKLYKEWREITIKCLANVEAFIDFYEEENLEENILEEVDQNVKKLLHSIEMHLNDNRKGERLRNGVKVVILGEPNAGKSSLLNSICKRPAAIVSSIPGTTRDIIESAVNLAGYPILLSDTAGLRKTSDSIEIEGVKRAYDKIEDADILLIVVDVKSHINSILEQEFEKFLKQHLKYELNLKKSLNNEQFLNWLLKKDLIVCLNKKDLLNSNEVKRLNEKILNEKKFQINKISCVDNQSSLANDQINELLDQMKQKLKKLCSNEISEMPSITQQRHRDNLQKCITCLKKYLELTSLNYKSESCTLDFGLCAEELRMASKWIGTITGHILNEDILDVIFKDFCIGK